MKYILIYWFKSQSARAAVKVLSQRFNSVQIQEILTAYWEKYLKLKPDVPASLTLGGSLMVHLAAMSVAFYQAVTEKGLTEKDATQLFYDIAWKVYRKMGRLSWWLAGFGNSTRYIRLRKATKLFRLFPFSSPSYKWVDVETSKNIVGFDCIKCPVAEYFKTKNLSGFCAATWCSLDYPLAEMWHARLNRNGSIAGGSDKCDFRWIINYK